MNAKKLIVALCLTAFCPTPLLAASSFFDSFEGATLNPFWAPVTSEPQHRYSNYSLSTDHALSGTQSLKFTFDSGNLSDYPGFYMGHMFDSPVQGTFSVWYYDDTSLPVVGGLYLDDRISQWANIGIDYGSSTVDYNYNVVVSGSGGGLVNQVVGPRSNGWHHYEMNVTNAGTSYKLDGNDIIGISPLTSGNYLLLNSILRSTSGGAVYFDDFSYQASVPIPSTLWLFGSALAGFVKFSRRKSF